MKHYRTEIKLPLLQRHNRRFFANAPFHGDKGYLILAIDGKNYLRVVTKLTGVVYYEINPDNYELTYSNLT